MNAQTQYLEHQRQLLTALAARAEALLAAAAFREDSHHSICEQLQALCNAPSDESFYQQGQALLVKIVAAWPQLTPAIARDLFWFFGGDCLQFMPDEEIARFQTLDERRFELESAGQPFDYQKEKQKVFSLH